MLMLHAAKLSNGQTLAGRQQFFVAHIFLLAGLQAPGGTLMGSGNGAVPGNVRLGFALAVVLSATQTVALHAMITRARSKFFMKSSMVQTTPPQRPATQGSEYRRYFDRPAPQSIIPPHWVPTVRFGSTTFYEFQS
jgi:hypothetical protein